MAQDLILAGHIICRGRPLNSFAVSRATNSIDPDQTEPTLFAKNISKMFQQKTKQIIVRGDRDSRANLMPIYGDLYQINF